MCTRNQTDGSWRQVHRGDQAVCRVMHGQNFCCYEYALGYLTLTISLPLFLLFYSRFQMSHGLSLFTWSHLAQTSMHPNTEAENAAQIHHGYSGFVYCMLNLRLLRTILSNLGGTNSVRLLRI